MNANDFTSFARRLIYGLGPTTLAVPISLGVFVGGALVAILAILAPGHAAPEWATICVGVCIVTVPWVLLGKHRRTTAVMRELVVLEEVMSRGKFSKVQKKEAYRRVARALVSAIESGGLNDENMSQQISAERRHIDGSQ